MICLTKPALATAIGRIESTLIHRERRRDRGGALTVRRAEKSSRARIRQTRHHQSLKNPRVRMASATGGRCDPRVPGRRCPPPLSPLPSRERFQVSCVLFLSECQAAGPAGRAAFMRKRGRRIGKEVEEGRDRWAGVSGGFATRPGRLTRLGLPRRARSGRIPSRRFHQRLSPVLHGSTCSTPSIQITSLYSFF
jgi:hypothetical protein